MMKTVITRTRADEEGGEPQQESEEEEFPKVFVGEVWSPLDSPHSYLLCCCLLAYFSCNLLAVALHRNLSAVQLCWEPLKLKCLPQVPIMLRSTYCCLNEHNDKGLTDLGECPYDQVPPLSHRWSNSRQRAWEQKICSVYKQKCAIIRSPSACDS